MILSSHESRTYSRNNEIFIKVDRYLNLCDRYKFLKHTIQKVEMSVFLSLQNLQKDRRTNKVEARNVATETRQLENVN